MIIWYSADRVSMPIRPQNITTVDLRLNTVDRGMNENGSHNEIRKTGLSHHLMRC